MYSHCPSAPPQLSTCPSCLIMDWLWSENNTHFHSKTFWLIFQFSHKNNTVVSTVRNEGYDISLFLHNSSFAAKKSFLRKQLPHSTRGNNICTEMTKWLQKRAEIDLAYPRHFVIVGMVQNYLLQSGIHKKCVKSPWQIISPGPRHQNHDRPVR